MVSAMALAADDIPVAGIGQAFREIPKGRIAERRNRIFDSAVASGHQP